MAQTLNGLVDDLIGDKTIDDKTKVEMLSEWKNKIVAKNGDRLMDKYEAEKHFACLGKIDGAIAAYEGAVNPL